MVDPIFAKVPMYRIPILLQKCRDVLTNEYGYESLEAEELVGRLREMILEAHADAKRRERFVSEEEHAPNSSEGRGE